MAAFGRGPAATQRHRRMTKVDLLCRIATICAWPTRAHRGHTDRLQGINPSLRQKSPIFRLPAIKDCALQFLSEEPTGDDGYLVKDPTHASACKRGGHQSQLDQGGDDHRRLGRVQLDTTSTGCGWLSVGAIKSSGSNERAVARSHSRAIAPVAVPSIRERAMIRG